jgi:hypothetical protein
MSRQMQHAMSANPRNMNATRREAVHENYCGPHHRGCAVSAAQIRRRRNSLTAAVLSKDVSALAAARQDVMLAARQAIVELHHLSDFVRKEPSPKLQFTKIEDVRKAVGGNAFSCGRRLLLQTSCCFEVADAFEHHRPDRPNTRVQVSTDILSKETGFSEGRFGEGKFGGVEQVIITTNDGDRRALSSVLQSCHERWSSRAFARVNETVYLAAPLTQTSVSPWCC